MGIHCISFYEESWMVRSADRQQWNHITNAYGGSYALYDKVGFVWDDAVHNPDNLPVYVFDETGTLPAESWTYPADAIFVFGITGMDVTQVVPEASRDGVFKINTPNAVPLWGCQAAGIALSHRNCQLS